MHYHPSFMYSYFLLYTVPINKETVNCPWVCALNRLCDSDCYYKCGTAVPVPPGSVHTYKRKKKKATYCTPAGEEKSAIVGKVHYSRTTTLPTIYYCTRGGVLAV